LIRDASKKVMNSVDKPTKNKKKVIEKVIEKIVHTPSNKRIRKPPQKFSANKKKRKKKEKEKEKETEKEKKKRVFIWQHYLKKKGKKKL
jgi:hypothetical protein